jgi:hypothetical protein
MIEFESYLNLEEMEGQLKKHYKDSLRKNRLDLDLSKVEWISALSAATIYSWAYEIISEKGGVTLIEPQKRAFASAIFTSTGIHAAFQSLGADIERSAAPSPGFRSGKLATFQCFSTEDEYEKHVTSLDQRDALANLLNTDTPPTFVSSGNFHRIALRELLDNSFIHGHATNSFYVAFEAEAQPAPRLKHPIFSHFGKSAYLELCVGDSSDTNIVDTLFPHMGMEYSPRARGLKEISPLDDIEKCILHAFEYGSTSNLERRRNKVLSMLSGSDEDIRCIATGLYDVLTLAKIYRGQIIIRTAGRLGTLDYFGDSPHALPRVSFWRISKSHQLAPLRGTMILLRIPLEDAEDAQKYALPFPKKVLLPLKGREYPDYSLVLVAPAPGLSASIDPVSLLADLERRTISECQSASLNKVVVVLIDGLDIPSKTYGALLQLLLRVPRKMCGLVLVTHDKSNLLRAREQWDRFSTAQGSGIDQILRFPSFLVLSDGDMAPVSYGKPDELESTTEDTSLIRFPFPGEITPFHAFLDRVRSQRLADLLKSDYVCHSGGLFLIQSRYYTESFFEISKLLANETMRSTALLWLKSHIETISPATIIVNTPIFEELLKEAMPDWVARHSLFLAKPDNIMSTALYAMSASKGGRILFLIDVLCTGESLLIPLLEILSGSAELGILALVDARESAHSYITIQKEERSVDTRILCCLREPVQILTDRPANVNVKDVYVVDPITHSPTKYPLPESSGLDTSTLLERAAKAGALGIGHYEKADKHYLYYLSLRDVFMEIENELREWLEGEAGELLTTPQEKHATTRVYCLDEGTALFTALEYVTRKHFATSPLLITKEKLFAPPIIKDPVADSVWFVLPAMASGTTLAHCLEYAVAIGAKKLRVSIVAARVEPGRLLFFQNIRRYHDIDVRIRFMFDLPLVAYGERQCPACSLAGEIRIAINGLKGSRHRLKKYMKEALARLKKVALPISSGLPIVNDGLTHSWEEANLRCIYERALRDVEARSDLRKQLLLHDGQKVQFLASAVGRGSGDPSFSPLCQYD